MRTLALASAGRFAVIVAVSATVAACGGAEPAPPPVAPRLTAEDSILQVSRRFSAMSEDRRLLSPPSEIAIHQRRLASTLSFAPSGPSEELRVIERYEFRNGHVTECAAETTRPLKAAFAFEQGETTVVLSAAPTQLEFRCTAGIPRTLEPELAASTRKLALRDESLVVLTPAADRRRYLPAE